MSLEFGLEEVLFQIQSAAITETKRISNSSTPWKLIPSRGGCFKTNKAIFNWVLKCTFLAATARTIFRQVIGHTTAHCGIEHLGSIFKNKSQNNIQRLSESQFLLLRACFAAQDIQNLQLLRRGIYQVPGNWCKAEVGMHSECREFILKRCIWKLR